MASLRMPDILCATYDTLTEGTSGYSIYDIQNTLLSSFIFETVEQDYDYLLQEKISAWDQYKTLQEYFDLGHHAHRYHAIKEIWNYRYTTKESAIATITAFATRMREAGVRTLD
jgi:hypothetical protein